MAQARSQYPGARQKGPAWGSGAGGARRTLRDPAAGSGGREGAGWRSPLSGALQALG